jgi:hypothetical protein
MYLAAIVLLMGLLPVGSILVEYGAHANADLIVLIGKWFVFWSVGIRLILAGARQIFNPAFTAETIFDVREKGALTIVQELGFANLSIGLIAALSLFFRDWVAPAAVAGGLFYGLAGIKHLTKGDRNATENIAMISDLFISVVLAGFLAASVLRA